MNNDKNYFDRIAERGQLIVISGPYGMGVKDVINEYLAQHPSGTRCVGVTTREPREGEQDGVDFNFISNMEFERMIRTQEMMEYVYHQRTGYGTPKKAVEDARAAGKNVILRLDLVGAMKVRALCPDATLIFILPATWNDLKNNIISRNLSKEEIEAELMVAQEEIQCMGQYDYILVNENIGKTVSRLGQIIHGNRYSQNSMKAFVESYIESEINTPSELVQEILSL